MKQSCPTSTMWRHLLHYPLTKKSGFALELLQFFGLVLSSTFYLKSRWQKLSIFHGYLFHNVLDGRMKTLVFNDL